MAREKDAPRSGLLARLRHAVSARPGDSEPHPGWPVGVGLNQRWSEVEPAPLDDLSGTGPPVFTRSDRLLRADIEDRLTRHVPEVLPQLHLSVHRGRVILFGLMPDDDTIARVLALVGDVHGVRGVVNQLQTMLLEEH
ncbi:MAG: BON domain-containing protein [Myxococcota bacterium]